MFPGRNRRDVLARPLSSRAVRAPPMGLQRLLDTQGCERRAGGSWPPPHEAASVAAVTASRRSVHDEHDLLVVPSAVITASDTRTASDDRSGRLAVESLEGAGHRVVYRRIVREDPEALASCLQEALTSEARLILVTGGTGVGPRDRSPELVSSLCDTPLPGFGEAFRARSWEAIGPRAWLSRATAGLSANRLLVALPGSPRAVSLGLQEVLLPVLPHLIGLASNRTAPPPQEAP